MGFCTYALAPVRLLMKQSGREKIYVYMCVCIYKETVSLGLLYTVNMSYFREDNRDICSGASAAQFSALTRTHPAQYIGV